MSANVAAPEVTGFDRWMARHNGPDAIVRVASPLAAALLVAGIATKMFPLTIAAGILTLACLWRVLSTDIIKRRSEEASFLSHAGFMRPWLANPSAARAERKSYKHVTCPTCGQKARIPRGAGKVVVTCPGCGETYIKKV